MSKAISAHAVPVDGYITGRGPGRGLGDATMLFDWYADSGWSAGGTPHPTAPLVVLSHRPAPQSNQRQTFVSTVAAGLVDEVILHQVPILLGGGRPFFQSLPEHVHLRLIEAVVAPGVTQLHCAVDK
jgi:hypothetical protein